MRIFILLSDDFICFRLQNFSGEIQLHFLLYLFNTFVKSTEKQINIVVSRSIKFPEIKTRLYAKQSGVRI